MLVIIGGSHLPPQADLRCAVHEGPQWAYSVEKLDCLPDGTSKLERCSQSPPK